MIAKHVIGSALIEGRRRRTSTPRPLPPPPSTPRKSPGGGLGLGHPSPPATGRPSGSPDSLGGTLHQVSKLNLMTSEEETAAKSGARSEESVDRRAEGDGVRTDRSENSREVKQRKWKERQDRLFATYFDTAGESPPGSAEQGTYLPESRGPWNTTTVDAADIPRAAGQTPTPSKSPGKRLASQSRQDGGQEQKKVRLSLTATEVIWGNKSIACGGAARPEADFRVEIPPKEAWSSRGIFSPSRGRSHGRRVPGLAKKTSFGHDEIEDIEDDSNHSSLEHSDLARVSDKRLPGKRAASRSDMVEERDPPKRARLSPRPEGQLDHRCHRGKCDRTRRKLYDRAGKPLRTPPSSAAGAVPSNVGLSIQPRSSEANHLCPKEPQRRSYLSAAWMALRDLCGWKSRESPRP